jgi:NIPSNAP
MVRDTACHIFESTRELCPHPRAAPGNIEAATSRRTEPMIYELRVYRSMPGRLPALLARFQNHTLRIWEKHGIRQAGFWTTLVGESSQEITYMLVWESVVERQRRWEAFRADPEWIAISAESEKDGQLVENISNQLLAPTEFSSAR